MKIFVSSVLAVASLAATGTRAAFPADVTALLDTSVDPCDDFYQYSCGAWIKNTTIPADRTTYIYADDQIDAKNQVLIQEIIKEDWPLVGELWDSCTGRDALTALGGKPLQKDLNRITATASKKDLAKLSGELGSVGPSLFAGPGLSTDLNDAKKYALYAGSPVAVLPDWSYYTEEGGFADLEAPFRKYVSTLVKLAGISVSQNGQQGQQGGATAVDPKVAEDIVIKFEKAMASIQRTDDEDTGTLTFAEAATKFPTAFKAVMDGVGFLDRTKASSSTPVYVDSIGFMERAEALYAASDLKELKIYYSFLYTHVYGEYLGEAFQQARFELFNQKIRGQTVRPSAQRVCTRMQLDVLPDLIGKYYFLKAFDSDREKSVQEMVNAIEHAMGDHIANVTWLDAATRKSALEKLSKVTNLIGHSTQKKSYPFVLTRDNLFQNIQAIWYAEFDRKLKAFTSPVDRSEWSMSAAEINAYYQPTSNQIVFPAAILQPPYFIGGAHPAQNFGAIGAVLGHELTHGFDSSGRLYDGDGNRRNWWSDESAAEFETRATCMKQQYSSFPAYGDSGKPVGNVNGNQTITENIADNGGLGLAFDAYKAWLKSGVSYPTNGVTEAEADKLFFVSYGYSWCTKMRDAYVKLLITTDVHSPAPLRVNGVVMNNDDFAKTFQCKVGSKMNPEKKCKIW